SKRLATHSPAGAAQTLVQFQDTATGGRLGRLALEKFIHGLAFSPDRRTFAVGYVGGTCLVFFGRNRSMLKQTSAVSELLFSPDGTWLVTGSQHGWGINDPSCFRLWQITSTPQPHVRAAGVPQPTSDAPRFAFTPDSKVLLTLELAGGRLRCWQVGLAL